MQDIVTSCSNTAKAFCQRAVCSCLVSLTIFRNAGVRLPCKGYQRNDLQLKSPAGIALRSSIVQRALCNVRVLLASRPRHSCSDICLALSISDCSVKVKLSSLVSHCEPQRGATSSAISQRSYPMLGLVHSSMRTDSRKCIVEQGMGKYQNQSDLKVGC